MVVKGKLMSKDFLKYMLVIISLNSITFPESLQK
jgi:hypothetical protein